MYKFPGVLPAGKSGSSTVFSFYILLFSLKDKDKNAYLRRQVYLGKGDFNLAYGLDLVADPSIVDHRKAFRSEMEET